MFWAIAVYGGEQNGLKYIGVTFDTGPNNVTNDAVKTYQNLLNMTAKRELPVLIWIGSSLFLKFPLDKTLFRKPPLKNLRSANSFIIRLPDEASRPSVMLSCTELSSPLSLGEISPEDANRLGYELAMKFTKGQHQFVVSTHVDKAHIHTHIKFNSTNLNCDT